MMPVAPPEPRPAATESPRRGRLVVLGLALGGLLVGGAAALAWALAAWLDNPALASAMAVATVSLPLAGLLFKLLRDVERSRGLLARLDGADAAAGAASRHHFLSLAEREWARARRYGGEPALLLVDVDRFQRLCESRGEGAGDAVLREIVRDVAPTLRGADAMARFGGSQLAVWLAQVDPIGALDVADRIRERAEALQVAWQLSPPLRVTVSVGVAALRPAHQNLASLLADAEQAVQAARQSGGNCVRAAPVDLARLRRIGPSVGDNQAAGPTV